MKNFKIKALIFIFFFIISFAVFAISDTFMEPMIQSWLTKRLTYKSASENVVLVVIDDKSISKLRWPWKRAVYADIFQYINEYGQAKVVAFDSLFKSPDVDHPQSDEYFFSTIKKYDNYIGAFDGSNSNDKKAILTEEQKKLFNSKITIQIKDSEQPTNTTVRSVLGILPEYIESSPNFGSVITPQGADGVIRSALPAVKIDDKIYPMLAFSAYAKYTGQNKFILTDQYLCSDDNCKTLKINIYPSSIGNQMYLRWYKPLDEFTTHKSYSAIDVLDSLDAIKKGQTPTLDPKIFQNKIVLVGGNANVKSLEDIKDTPIIARTHAGVDIQATVISNLLENTSTKILTDSQKYLIAMGIILLCTWIIITFGLTESIVSLSIIMISYIITAVVLFSKGTIIEIITPVFLIILVIATGFTYRFLMEGKRKAQIENAMGLYISKDIMKSVVKNIDNLKIGGKRANITVLFADIRGFTSISEKLPAEEVTEILNEYFSAVEPIITKHKGVLNKFIGDAVLAIFGEPIQDKNHALNAVLCANEMHKAIDKLQHKWEFEGKPKIEIGIAINTGEAFVGNIGSSERIEYTVIGDTVNTASRIEAYNKVYRTRFLISESTYEKVSRICDVIKIREVAIRGKALKINIYEVIRVLNNNDNNK